MSEDLLKIIKEKDAEIDRLNNTVQMKALQSKNEKIKQLEQKLAVAISELESIEKYIAFNGDTWVRDRASQALAQLKEQGEKNVDKPE